MSGKRPVILMAILLVLMLAYIGRPFWEHRLYGNTPTLGEPPLPGKNSISGLQVTQDADGRWKISYDYFYTGEPAGAQLQAEQEVTSGAGNSAAVVRVPFSFDSPQRGAHKVIAEVRHPVRTEPVTTTRISVRMQHPHATLASQQILQTITWPDYQTWAMEQEWRGKTPTQLLDKAVALIDIGDEGSLREAREILERLVSKDSQFDPAYVELARVAMKSNWGPEGLHQAETLIASALQIHPNSVNAKILLGYVYAHQKRYKQAEALFVEASGSDTRNLWLWSNWGEVLAMQGHTEQAIQKYREAVTKPRTHDTYDKARLDAYWHLLEMLRQRHDLDGMEALHKQRTEEFGPNSCYLVDYALFLVQERGAVDSAIALAKQALNPQCPPEDARQVLGMAHYMAWASAPDGAGVASLNQARVYLPSGPYPLYLLATSDRTTPAVRKLVASGESIDQRDNNRLTALSYALQRHDLAAAKRLLRLGAHPEAPIGEADMPVALLPVVSSDLAGIRLMQQFGVDYTKLRYKGTTALDRAKQIGDRQLIEALDRKANAL